MSASHQKHMRERRCVATGQSLPERHLIRFAVGPDGMVVPDVAAKLPGRGVWVSASRQGLETAIRKGGFARSLKAPVAVPAGLAEQTEALLARRCLDFLGLARRAGALAFGATQVDAAIRAKPVFALVEASDGAADGREKLQRLHIGLWGRPAPGVGCFSAEELGMALGRDRVIHACLLQERMALDWAAEIGRLSGFRAIVPGSWPDSWRGLGLGDADAGPSLAAAPSKMTSEDQS
ncbi:MAG TPA: RNA-binding protein [Caulobacterales bacterium]|nr:RNA-binding protein [Caulobacterales bacterium]